jgi:hypothetical protein
MYLPPSSSLYYNDTEIDNGVSLLEHCLTDLYEQCGELPTIICGDLNARTSCQNGKDVCLPDEDDNDDNEDYFQRVSKDNRLNDFGRHLLSVCDQFSLLILNGFSSGDENGEFTYVAHNGSSVIDYFIMSKCMIHLVPRMFVKPMIESKHMPVEMKVNTCKQINTVSTPSYTKLRKYLWDKDKTDEFTSQFTTDYSEVLATIETATDLINVNVNDALVKFNDSLRKAGSCMQKTITVGKEKQNVWFDSECYQKRRILRKLLRKYQKTRHSSDAADVRASYTEQRKLYKETLKQKKTAHRQHTIDTLNNSCNDPKKFWSTVKSVTRKGYVQNTISAEEWFDHFSNVFSSGANREAAAASDSTDPTGNLMHDTLDCDISIDEVQKAIKALKNSKAPGPDGLISEFYKHSGPFVLNFFTKLFNRLFETGEFPEEWTESIIQPLHKKGDINSPDNYRGISLLNVSSKLYSYILNKRLTKWIEENRVVSESQAGFRRNYSTIDHIFTLLALVQKQLLSHKKLYVAFIDFKKAFDLVDRSCLWAVLNKKGVNGRMYRAIRSMYKVVKARVRAGSNLSESFMCPRGVRQGETCSPVLFSLLINELANDIEVNGKHGVTLCSDLLQVFILLFADDVILMSYTIIGLQHQLNLLQINADKLGLTVNLEKSKIVVFRKGGYIAGREKWFYNNAILKIVNHYKYLGVIFSTGLTFSYSLEDMATRAKKGVFGLLKLIWTLGNQSPRFFFKLFDSQIQPMLTYGSEVWGLMADHGIIERVHLFALRRFLNVSAKTPRALVYGDTGRYPLHISTNTRCIKYWLKLFDMENDRLPLKSYKMLYRLHCNNKNNWASCICYTLYRYGFGHVWENQGVANSKLFLRVFKQRLIDCYLQDWNSDITSKDRFSFYSTFKSVHTIPSHIFDINNIAVRKSLIRFRLGVSPLKPHKFRHSTSSPNLYDCPFCIKTIESELHFLFTCPKYEALRNEYLPVTFMSHPSAFKAAILLASERYTKHLALYIYKALQLRQVLMTDLV